MNKEKTLQINQIKQFLDENEKYFNQYKNPIDRAYFIYDKFRYAENYGYKVEKLTGSNQVLLYKNDQIIYDRFNENIKQRTPKQFKHWVYQILKNYITQRDKQKPKQYIKPIIN